MIVPAWVSEASSSSLGINLPQTFILLFEALILDTDPPAGGGGGGGPEGVPNWSRNSGKPAAVTRPDADSGSVVCPRSRVPVPDWEDASARA